MLTSGSRATAGDWERGGGGGGGEELQDEREDTH